MPTTVHGASWVDPDYWSPPEDDTEPEGGDLLNRIIEHETGTLGPRETLELFAELIRTGQAWTLQGHYGRVAQSLIDNGAVSAAGVILLEDDYDPLYVYGSDRVEDALKDALRYLQEPGVPEDLPVSQDEAQALVTEVANQIGVPSVPVTLFLGMPTPSIGVTEDYSIGFAPEALRLLNEDELRGAIAHELGHIQLGHVVDRRRGHDTEYAADAFAREHGYGDELASTLAKLARWDQNNRAYPYLDGSTATHPDPRDRIARLTS